LNNQTRTFEEFLQQFEAKPESENENEFEPERVWTFIEPSQAKIEEPEKEPVNENVQETVVNDTVKENVEETPKEIVEETTKENVEENEEEEEENDEEEEEEEETFDSPLVHSLTSMGFDKVSIKKAVEKYYDLDSALEYLLGEY